MGFRFSDKKAELYEECLNLRRDKIFYEEEIARLAQALDLLRDSIKIASKNCPYRKGGEPCRLLQEEK
jgi:hypothetical protein